MSERANLSRILGLTPKTEEPPKIEVETSRYLEESLVDEDLLHPQDTTPPFGLPEVTKITGQYFPSEGPGDVEKIAAIAEHLVKKTGVQSEQAADVVLRGMVRDAREELSKDKRKIPVLDRVFRRVRLGVLAK